MQWWYNAEGAVKANIKKAEVEAKLGKYLKGKLSSDKVELSADLGAASISCDDKGNISGSYGILKGEGQFNGMSAELKALGVDVAGAQLTLSNFFI